MCGALVKKWPAKDRNLSRGDMVQFRESGRKTQVRETETHKQNEVDVVGDEKKSTHEEQGRVRKKNEIG